ncbi:MAG: NAD(P)/FAD-dependent oxidoreductase [Candidatus Promineifilaceae bacterium]
MTRATADVVICGAGIAGISAAYHLAVERGVGDVALVDDRPPLSLTSDKSTECYRNWWPGPGRAMVAFMNRSLAWLERLAEASDNYFGLNRRGYVFLTADAERAAAYRPAAEAISALGAGPVRVHERDLSGYRPAPAEGYRGQPDGADLVLGSELIRQLFPFLAADVAAMLQPRRAGWLSAQQLGMWLLERARAAGVRLLADRVSAVRLEKGRVAAVELASAGRLETRAFVDAAGPLVGEVAKLLGVELPVFNELHAKLAFNDSLGILPRDLGLMIWDDPISLAWSAEEREELAADPEGRRLLAEFPAGLHFRPEGGPGSRAVLALWTYDLEPQAPAWPPRFDPAYADVVLRGLGRMAPGLAAYAGRLARPVVDGGYYCKTAENRPLIGPLPVEGAFVIGALSGYGVMASQAAAELLAAHITGEARPAYAADFELGRYQRPDYRALLADWQATSGQL